MSQMNEEKGGSLRAARGGNHARNPIPIHSNKGSMEHIDDQEQESNFERGRFGSIGGESFLLRSRRRDSCNLRTHSLTGNRSPTVNRHLEAQLKTISRQVSCPLDKTELADKTQMSDAPEPPQRFNSRFHGYRFVVVMLGGLGIGLMLMLRFNVSIALLRMVNRTELLMKENPHLSLAEIHTKTNGVREDGEFVWDNEIQQIIMSYYMFTYTLPQMPSAKLAQKIGSRISMPITLSLCGLANLLTPWAAYWGWRWVVALRLLNGLGAAAVLPIALNLVENWMPYSEISLGLTIAQIVQSIVMVGNQFFIGQLAGIQWSYAFYVPGLITLVFVVLWPFLVTSKADEHWLVSEQELDTICGCSKGDATPGGGHKEEAHRHKLQSRCQQTETNRPRDEVAEPAKTEDGVSWTRVLTVRSFYAYLVIWLFHCCTQSCFVFVMPLYLSQFLKASVSESGALCSMVMLGAIVSVLWPHPLMRFLELKIKLSPTGSRRVCFAIVCLMQAGTGLFVGLFHQWQLILFFLNRCFQSSNDIIVTGTIMSNFSKSNLGSLTFSMVNTVGNLSVVFGSSFIGYILDKTGQSREGWLMVFATMSCGQFLVLLIFSTLITFDPIDLDRGSKRKQVDDVQLKA